MEGEVLILSDSGYPFINWDAVSEHLRCDESFNIVNYKIRWYWQMVFNIPCVRLCTWEIKTLDRMGRAK